MIDSDRQDILVVDDTPANLQLLNDILSVEGYRVRPASSGNLALRSMAVEVPDLILLDVRMPEPDGFEVCRRVKADPRTAEVPIIFISAVEDISDKVKGFNVGGVDYITKPFQPDEVLARVHTHLKIKRLRTDLECAYAELEHRVKQRTDQLNKANISLTESEMRYRLLVEMMNEGIIAIDRGTHLTYANPQMCSMLGYSSDEMLGRPIADFFDETNQKILASWSMRRKSGKRDHYEIEWLRKDGTRIPTLISPRALSEEGDYKGSFAVVTDITVRKRVEEKKKEYQNQLEAEVKRRTVELSIAKEEAEAASRLKSEFLSNMSHDLRTPLNAILGFAQILKRQNNQTEKQKKQLQVILGSGEHLLMLINDILDLGKIEAGKLVIASKIVNLEALINNILHISRIRAEAKGLDIKFEPLTRIPPTVLGDERKIRQVLLNLLDNAIKFTDQGSISLRVLMVGSGGLSKKVKEEKQRSGEGVGRTFILQVEDTGKGIAKEKIDEIFEPFTHGEVYGGRTEGTGLGLAICSRLIHLMNGKLSVESKEGHGSLFTIELMLPLVENSGVRTKKVETIVKGYDGQRKKILIADDNMTNSFLMVSLLEPLGFDIVTAESGAEAVERAAKSIPDLILMDLLMPGMDGHEALRQIRNNPELAHIKVIGVSAAVADKIRVEMFASDCDDFLSKPIDTMVVLEKLRGQLQIQWIEESIKEPLKTEPLMIGNGTKIKVPQKDVEKLIWKVERGDYAGLEQMLERMLDKNAEYAYFCNKIRSFAKKYNDGLILDYLRKNTTCV